MVEYFLKKKFRYSKEGEKIDFCQKLAGMTIGIS